jgi:hypothetical protein
MCETFPLSRINNISYPNGIKLGKAKKQIHSKFISLQFENVAISTLFRAYLNAIRLLAEWH